MFKMTDSSKGHRYIMIVGGADHLFVTDRTARFDHSRGTRLDRLQQTVGEGEVRVGRNRASCKIEIRFPRFLCRDP